MWSKVWRTPRAPSVWAVEGASKLSSVDLAEARAHSHHPASASLAVLQPGKLARSSLRRAGRRSSRRYATCSKGVRSHRRPTPGCRCTGRRRRSRRIEGAGPMACPTQASRRAHCCWRSADASRLAVPGRGLGRRRVALQAQKVTIPAPPGLSRAPIPEARQRSHALMRAEWASALPTHRVWLAGQREHQMGGARDLSARREQWGHLRSSKRAVLPSCSAATPTPTS